MEVNKEMAVSEIGSGSQMPTAPLCLFVGQVPKNMVDRDLRAVLEEFGPIETLTVIKDHSTGLSKGKFCSSRVYDSV